MKLVLSTLWITMLFVFAYVDIFAYLRADVLKAALDGKIATTGFTVDQVFLTYTLVYILIPVLMVVLSLLLKPRVNRIANISVSLVYLITVIGSAVGEKWVYYIIGSRHRGDTPRCHRQNGMEVANNGICHLATRN